MYEVVRHVPKLVVEQVEQVRYVDTPYDQARALGPPGLVRGLRLAMAGNHVVKRRMHC